MPGIDGIELCARVRQLAGYQNTPIIMLTAMSDHDHIDKAFRAGATDYVTKPFNITELGTRLRLAQDILTLQQQLAAALVGQNVDGRMDRNVPALEIGEPVYLPGVPDLIEMTSFCNYLKQMSRSGLSVTQVFAVKIDRIVQIHGRASMAEYIEALTEVAQAIVAALLTASSISSHVGNGVFIGLARTTIRLDPTQLESDIQQILDERSLSYHDGSPFNLEVSVGTPIQPHFVERLDVMHLIERATTRAEQRLADKSAKHERPTIRMIRF